MKSKTTIQKLIDEVDDVLRIDQHGKIKPIN
jgi:hypothetical protein